MTFQNPTATDIATLKKGDEIKLNGRQHFTVTGIFDNFVTIEGPRGGWANLVPSAGGERVQLTRHTSDARTWIDRLEVAPSAPRIVDGGADLADRYTVEIDGHCWGFGIDPFHPQGFGQYCGEIGSGVSADFFESQTAVALADLPENARKFVEQKQREMMA